MTACFDDNVKNLNNAVYVSHLLVFLGRAVTAGIDSAGPMLRRLMRALAQSLEDAFAARATTAPTSSAAKSTSETRRSTSRATINTLIMKRFFTATTGSFVKPGDESGADRGAGLGSQSVKTDV
jgi:hypothetical protein